MFHLLIVEFEPLALYKFAILTSKLVYVSRPKFCPVGSEFVDYRGEQRRLESWIISCVSDVVLESSLVARKKLNMAKQFDAADFLQEISLGSLKGLVKAQLIEVASHVGADITRCSRKKEIFDVVVSHLGLRVGDEDELTPEHDTRPGTSAGDGRVDSTRIELAKLELEKEIMRAENLRLEEELMRP